MLPLMDRPIPVIADEAVELAKVYGGTDGHKYVNGVLEKLAAAVVALAGDSPTRLIPTVCVFSAGASAGASFSTKIETEKRR